MFDNVIAANPGEVVPVAKLVFHLGEFASVLLLEIGAKLSFSASTVLKPCMPFNALNVRVEQRQASFPSCVAESIL